MAKPLPILIGVLGLGATATGGYMLVKKGNEEGTSKGDDRHPSSTTVNSQTGGSAGSPKETAQTTRQNEELNPNNGERTQDTQRSQSVSQESQTEKTLIFEDIEKFNKDALTTSACLKEEFKELILTGSPGEDIDTDKPKNDKFFKTNGDPAPATKSCLIINWRKAPKTDEQKWNGKFTWLWTFKRGDEGFVNFNVMEPGTDGKAKFTGVFYLVEKEATADTWSVKFRKEVKDAGREVEKTNLDNYFPKVGDAVKGAEGKEPKDYWGFIGDKNELEEMCKAGSDCATSPVSKKFHWTASTAESKPLKEWSVDLKWWEGIYAEVKDKWNFGDKIKDFKGTWTEQQESQ